MFVQALWSSNPQEPQKLFRGKVEGTIKVWSGLLPVHTQAKPTYSFLSFHNDTINKAKTFLFSPNPLYYVVLFAVSRNWCSLHTASSPGGRGRLQGCLLASHHSPVAPGGPGRSVLGESLRDKEGAQTSEEREMFEKLELECTKFTLRNKQK